MKLHVTARDLCRMLEDCLPFAGTDDTLPMLTCIQLELDTDGTLIARSTDRYALAESRCHPSKVNDDGPIVQLDGKILLPCRAARAIVRNYKPTKNEPSYSAQTLALHTEAETKSWAADWLVITPLPSVRDRDVAKIDMRVPLPDFSFPDAANITCREPEAIAQFGVAPRLLIAASRRVRSKYEPMRVVMTGPNKPIRVLIGEASDDDELRVTIMPVRLPDGAGAGDWS